MKLPNRLAATTTCYLPYSLEDALSGLADAGYRHVELAAIRGICEHVPLDADTKTLGRIQRLLNRCAITPVALSAHSNLMTEAGLADARRGLDLCERLGIEIMNTAVSGAEDVAEDEALFLKHIGPLADLAAARGVTITLEVHGTLTGNGQNLSRLIEKVDRPNVCINYDTANCEYYTGTRALDDLPYALSRMGLCHLKDHIGGLRVWNFPALGQGDVDFPNLVAMLAQGGYTGPVSVEVEFEGLPFPPIATVHHAIKESRDYLRQLGLS